MVGSPGCNRVGPGAIDLGEGCDRVSGERGREATFSLSLEDPRRP